MATPAHAKTREERAKEIPFSEIIPQTDGYFLVKGKYLTDGVNCECGDSRYGKQDCVHSIRTREYQASGMPQSNVTAIADFR